MTDDAIRRILWRCIWQSRGSAPVDQDYAYWIPLWPGLVARGVEINHPNYGEDRVLGWQAGGADVAKFGPFADPPSAPHAVPPYPGDVVDPPISDPPPSQPPTFPPAIDVSAMFGVILMKLNDLEVAVLDLQAQHYEGTVQVPYLGTGKIVLTPKATP